MARQRSPDRIEAEKLYLEAKGEIKLIDIAEKLNRPEGTIRGWKNKDKWDEKINGTFQKENKAKRNAPKKKKETKPKHLKVVENIEIENAELTEKQRLFCLYYIKSFNATMAAIKAGYSKDTAHVIGHENLRKPKIAKEIKRLKGKMTKEVFIDAMDVLKKYIAIAFADITDFVTFGKKEVQAMGAFGPLEDDEGNPIMKEINFVDFKDSSLVDGTIIREAKQGRDGVSIKLEDRMKALEKLEAYFDLFPDKFKRKIEEEKLKIAKEKLEIEKTKVTGEEGEIEDDGFLEALQAEVSEVWDDA